MKVGIVTFNSAHNYGAVLQAWALQEFLSLEGHAVDVINYRLPAIDDVYRLFKPESPYDKPKKNAKHQKKQLQEVKNREPEKVLAFERFEQFIEKKLHTTKPYTSFAELSEEKFAYDALITGSDQVWNTGLTGGVNPAYLLDFGSEEARRISYAVSRGDKPLSDQDRLYFERKLAGFDFVSVREENVAEEIGKLTDLEVSVTADPTFLLEREHFDTIRKKYDIPQPYIYVHNVHLTRVDERLCSVAEELSKRTGLPIVANRKNQFEYSDELEDVSDIGPREFLDVIANAEYVVTNSFHATAFALIYHRNFITIPALRNPERMQKLLERLQVKNHLIAAVEELPEDLATLAIDYEALEGLKAEYVKASKQFLREALRADYRKDIKHQREHSYLRSSLPPACYACAACATACGTECIRMEKDAEGFLYPVRANAECGDDKECEKRCVERFNSIDTGENVRMYAAELYIADPVHNGFRASILEPFCNTILAQGGVVVAKVSKNQLQPEYRILRTAEDLLLLYMGCLTEGDIREGIARCEEALTEGKPVLFIGSPCEIASVRREITDTTKGELLTISTNCRGVTSERVMQKYIEFLEQKFESKLLELSFENRIKGFVRPYVYAAFENKEVSIEATPKHAFYKAFTKGRLSRPSCYSCIYKSALAKGTDIVLISNRSEEAEYLEEQTELLIGVNSEAGQRLLQTVKENFAPIYDENGERVPQLSISVKESELTVEQKRAIPYNVSPKREGVMGSLERLSPDEWMAVVTKK